MRDILAFFVACIAIGALVAAQLPADRAHRPIVTLDTQTGQIGTVRTVNGHQVMITP